MSSLGHQSPPWWGRTVGRLGPEWTTGTSVPPPVFFGDTWPREYVRAVDVTFRRRKGQSVHLSSVALTQYGCWYEKLHTCHRMLGWGPGWACNLSTRVGLWRQKLQIWQRLQGVLPSNKGVGSRASLQGGAPRQSKPSRNRPKYISHRCQLTVPAVDASHRVVPSIPQQTPGTSHPSTSASPGAPFPQRQGPWDPEKEARKGEKSSQEWSRKSSQSKESA